MTPGSSATVVHQGRSAAVRLMNSSEQMGNSTSAWGACARRCRRSQPPVSAESRSSSIASRRNALPRRRQHAGCPRSAAQLQTHSPAALVGALTTGMHIWPLPGCATVAAHVRPRSARRADARRTLRKGQSVGQLLHRLKLRGALAARQHQEVLRARHVSGRGSGLGTPHRSGRRSLARWGGWANNCTPQEGHAHGTQQSAHHEVLRPKSRGVNCGRQRAAVLAHAEEDCIVEDGRQLPVCHG